MKGTVLQADDFEVGMTVTGYSSEPVDVPMSSAEGVATAHVQDRMYNHGVYRIKAIERPYLALECLWHQGGSQMTGMFQADTRIYHFMKVSEEYAGAFPNQAEIAKNATSQFLAQLGQLGPSRSILGETDDP